MSHRCLVDLLEGLGRSGELARVGVEVAPDLEIAEVACRAFEAGGPAVLFGEVAGCEIPLVAGLWGTQERILFALGAEDLDEAAGRLAALAEPEGARGWLQRLRAATGQDPFAALAPRTVRSGPSQQVVRLGEDVDLGLLPALRCWPDEKAAALSGGVLTFSDHDGRTHLARHELVVLDRRRLAVVHAPFDPFAAVWEEHRHRGQPMPVAASWGGEPEQTFAAVAPLPPGIDRSGFAGVLRGKALDVLPGRTLPLHVPAEAEVVVEGFVDPAGEAAAAGPVAVPTGCCRNGAAAPVVEVTAMTQRANPVAPAMIFGAVPNEGTRLQAALARIVKPLVTGAVPGLVDYALPEWAAARHVVFAAVRKTFPGQARRTVCGLWSQAATLFGRVVVVVDEGVDLADAAAVGAALAQHVDPASDVFFVAGPPDPWDPAAASVLPQRMAVDATRKLPGERSAEPAARLGRRDAAIAAAVAERWTEYGLGIGLPGGDDGR